MPFIRVAADNGRTYIRACDVTQVRVHKSLDGLHDFADVTTIVSGVEETIFVKEDIDDLVKRIESACATPPTP